VAALVGADGPRLGIDREHRLPEELHARLGHVRVGEPDGVRRRAPEQDVELRVAEDERVAPVDQRDLELLARLRQRRRELQAAEPCTEDQDAHAPILRLSQRPTA
jgi:hypothetical protein